MVVEKLVADLKQLQDIQNTTPLVPNSYHIFVTWLKPGEKQCIQLGEKEVMPFSVVINYNYFK